MTFALDYEQYWMIWRALNTARHRVEVDMKHPGLANIREFLAADQSTIEAGFAVINGLRAPVSPEWAALLRDPARE